MTISYPYVGVPIFLSLASHMRNLTCLFTPLDPSRVPDMNPLHPAESVLTHIT